jgi:hypothetical protein
MATDIPLEAAEVFRDAAGVLREDASLLRREFQKSFDAADPIPKVERLKGLATLFEEASNLREREIPRFVTSRFSLDDIKELDRVARLLDRPSIDPSASQKEARSRRSSTLREAHSILVRYMDKPSAGSPGA